MNWRLIKRRQVAQDSIKKHSVDEVIEAYVDWRNECMSVGDAYDRWTSAPTTDARLAFASYMAALDREEQAERLYAKLIGRVGGPVTDEDHREERTARARAEAAADRARRRSPDWSDVDATPGSSG